MCPRLRLDETIAVTWWHVSRYGKFLERMPFLTLTSLVAYYDMLEDTTGLLNKVPTNQQRGTKDYTITAQIRLTQQQAIQLTTVRQ